MLKNKKNRKEGHHEPKDCCQSKRAYFCYRSLYMKRVLLENRRQERITWTETVMPLPISEYMSIGIVQCKSCTHEILEKAKG